MKILITGANGMVARALAEHCREIGDTVIALTRAEMNIADEREVDVLLARYRPETIINCAAYTNVDNAEHEREPAYAANTRGVGNLAASARESGTRFVTISTDFVFDGSKEGFYTQRDTPSPQGVYAVTKYEGECLAAGRNAASIIVRSGWIYGHDGTNFLSIMDRLLAAGKPVSAITDGIGTPTFAGDLARRLRELAELDLPCIFHAANSGPGVTYYEFAAAVCEIRGYSIDLVSGVSEDSLSRPAPRPKNSRLECLFSERFGLAPMPEWREALERFLREQDQKKVG